MNPIFGVLISVIFLHEASDAMSLTGLAALILVSAGIIIVNRGEAGNFGNVRLSAVDQTIGRFQLSPISYMDTLIMEHTVRLQGSLIRINMMR